jgi:nucleotide-binding universal stress UspA family protein
MVQFKHILAPTDFGESSGRALEVAMDLSKKYAAALTLLHTYEIPGYFYPGMPATAADLLAPIREIAEKHIEETLAEIRKELPHAQSQCCFGVPWQEILRVVTENSVDLVVMGTHGRRGLSHALLGSVAEKTVRLCPVPVLTVRGPSKSSTPGRKP